MVSKLSVVEVTGPLAGVADRFGEALAEQGYTPLSAANQLRLLAHLSRWMSAEALVPAELGDGELERFLEARRRAGYVCWLSWRGLQPLVGVLRAEGVIPCPPVPVPSAMDVLLAEFVEFLCVEKGLAASTAAGRERVARRFLTNVDIEGLSAAAVVAYVGRTCQGVAVATAKLKLTGLRSLLRFLHVSGRVDADLSVAVLGAAGWRDTGVPKGLTDDQVAALLAACDLGRPPGRRDRALVLLLVRLGLRRGEAAGLRLDDIDWRAGELTITGKATRVERLPLPVDVGEALTDYLVHERRAASGPREVFLRVTAPHGPLTAEAVGSAVRNLAARAGLGPVGAHRLRHTAAMAMLRHGADLVEIGQVLRHRNLSTTAIYAKVDLVRLRRLTRPWPRPAVVEADLERQRRSLAPPWPHRVHLGEVAS
jgi:integrase/recombinase XerD